MKLILIVTFWSLCLTLYAQQTDFKHIDFEQADSIAHSLQGASLKNRFKLAQQLTAELPTDVEKFRAIFVWVSSNIENDYTASSLHLKKRRKYQLEQEKLDQWNQSFKKKSIRKLIQTKKTVCTGYDLLLSELASYANIETKIITGYGQLPNSIIHQHSIPNHSWTAVKLNNKWYLCDATWASGQTFLVKHLSLFKFDYIDGYFLTEPHLFAQNHYPLNKNWLLINQEVTFEDFYTAPIVTRNAFRYNVQPISPNKLDVEISKGAVVQFQLKTVEKIQPQQIQLLIFQGRRPVIRTPNHIKQHNGIITFDYQFKQRGLQDVHLQINNETVVIYTVFVTKS